MGCLAEQGPQPDDVSQAARHRRPWAEARRIIAGALPSVVAAVLEPAELEAVRQRLARVARAARARAPGLEAIGLGAVGVFLLVVLATFPVVIPFIFMQSAGPALRVSNAIAIVMLFVTGRAFGTRSTRAPGPWLMGISMVALGSDPRGHGHGAGRIARARDWACSSRSAIVLASDGCRSPRPGDERAGSPRRRTGRPSRPKRGRTGVVLLRLGLHEFRSRRPGLPAAHLHRGPRLAAPRGAVQASRRSTPARRGSVSTSPGGTRSSGPSRRWSAPCSATPTASRLVTRARSPGGSWNCTARASTSSTQRIQPTTSSTTGRS